jgi:MFS family permease
MSARVSPASIPQQNVTIRWQRLVALLAVTQTVGYGAMIQSFTVFLIPMSRDLGHSRTAIMGAATLSTLVGALAAVPVGNLLDRHGGRRLMATGSALGSTAVVGWSQAHSLAQLYLAFALIGVALALSTYEAAFAVLVVATEPRHRDGAITAVTMATGLATSFYYPLAGWLDAQLGWRASLLVLAASQALITIPIHLRALPDRRTHTSRIARQSGMAVGDALRSVRFWLLSFTFVARSGAVTAFLLIMVSYFRDVGYSATTAATMPLAAGALQILSRLVLAPLALRFGMTKVTAIAFAIQALGLLALPIAGTRIAMTIACVAAFGSGYGIGVVARPSIVADAFGVARFASIIAVTTVPMDLSRAGAPLLAAWLADWRFLVLLGTATLLAAAALMPLIRQGSRGGQADDQLPWSEPG